MLCSARWGKLDLQVSLGVLACNEGGRCQRPLPSTSRTPSDSFTICHAVKGLGSSNYQPVSLPISSHGGLGGPTLEMNQAVFSHNKYGVHKMPNQHLQMALTRKPRSSRKESPEDVCYRPREPLDVCYPQRHGVSMLSAFTWRGQNENTVATSMLSQQGEEVS